MKYIDQTGAISNTQLEGYYPVYNGAKPEPQQGEIVVEDTLEFKGDHWIQTWKVANKPYYTAGQWLEKMGLGTSEQPTLIYLKIALTSAGKTSSKLNQLEAYIQKILVKFATTLSSHNDWPYPPVTYEETVQEALEQLQS